MIEEVILKTNGLVKEYKDKKVLNDVTMNIRRGDVYGFVGENGAGKTTLIRAITGLINCNKGDYELFGISNKDSKICNSRRKVAGIVESPSIFGNLNALDNLLFQQALMGIKDEEKANELLKLVNLENVDLKKKVGDYSLGMRQRLAIAMCLVSDPEFLILDEPLNGLDPQGIVDMRNLIIELNTKKNITFLISSHILSELAFVATRYGIISKGKMVLEISKDEIQSKFRKQTNLYTSNNEKALELIKLNFSNIEVSYSDGFINIYENENNNPILELLIKNEIEIISVSNKQETFEDFYLQVMNQKEVK